MVNLISVQPSVIVQQQAYIVLSFLSFLQVFNGNWFSLGVQIIWDPLQD
jgi:hypothetical protein